MSTPDEAKDFDMSTEPVKNGAVSSHVSDEAREELARIISARLGYLFDPKIDAEVLARSILRTAEHLVAAGYRKLGPVTDAEVEAAARVLHQKYDALYDAPHLSWLDFADDARAALEASRSVLGNPQHETINQEFGGRDA